MNNEIANQISRQPENEKIKQQSAALKPHKNGLDLSEKGLQSGIAMSVILGDAVSRKRHKRSLREHL